MRLTIALFAVLVGSAVTVAACAVESDDLSTGAQALEGAAFAGEHYGDDGDPVPSEDPPVPSDDPPPPPEDEWWWGEEDPPAPELPPDDPIPPPPYECNVGDTVGHPVGEIAFQQPAQPPAPPAAPALGANTCFRRASKDTGRRIGTCPNPVPIDIPLCQAAQTDVIAALNACMAATCGCKTPDNKNFVFQACTAQCNDWYSAPRGPWRHRITYTKSGSVTFDCK